MYFIHDATYTAEHVVGNGRVCAYGCGVTVKQLFGPHYSAPDALSIRCVGGAEQAESRRLAQTGVWEHTLYAAHRPVSTVTDFAVPDRPLFIRRVNGEESTAWELTLHGRMWRTLSASLTGHSAGYWAQFPQGTRFYSYAESEEGVFGYVTTEPVLVGVLFPGAEGVEQDEPSHLRASLGRGGVAVAFAQDMKGLVEQLREIDEERLESLQTLAEEEGRHFTARYQTTLPLPSSRMNEVRDDIAALIRGQQAASGGVLAGPNYHLAYIRDNYGVLRGLLAMGCYDEARALIRFYIGVYARYGRLHNAQSTEGYGFHIHENDETEITGYVILMAMEYARRTGDAALLREARAMLWWCVEQQHGMLRDGMLPFNGDETYIAGGLLVRTAISDGSMEATALYHEACMRLLERAADIGLEESQTALLRADSEAIAERFADHFLVDGRLAANCPGYYARGEEPAAGHGVYLCGHGMGGCGCRNREGLLVCPECVDKVFPDISARLGERYFIPSAVLMLAFADVRLLCPAWKEAALSELLRRFRAGECLGGRPDGKMVGYEYGALLYAIRGQEKWANEADALRQALLGLRDEAGAWVEYYMDAQPSGCRCRPWESGINIAALLA